MNDQPAEATMFHINIRIYSAAILTVILSSFPVLAQTVPPGPGSASSVPWHSDSVVYVAGLDNLKQNTPGSLRITADDLVFSTHDTHEQIPLRRITLVSIGDERVATGGTSAKVARKIPLFGFGAAAGAVTSKMVDVLTIEFLDVHSGYHGAVFEVPKSQAEIAHQQLTAFAASPHQETSAFSCNQAAQPKTLMVAAIDEKGLQLPAEYRVLLYEQLVAELRKSYVSGTVLRVGDQAAGCPAETLHISVSAFKKGNEKLRSSTGPVGLFVGGTSVAFSAQLVNHAGAVVFEKSLKSSKHGDSDSLGVAHDVGQSVSKRLAKSKNSGFEAAV
jgi:hypothetical protein